MRASLTLRIHFAITLRIHFADSLCGFELHGEDPRRSERGAFEEALGVGVCVGVSHVDYSRVRVTRRRVRRPGGCWLEEALVPGALRDERAGKSGGVGWGSKVVGSGKRDSGGILAGFWVTRSGGDPARGMQPVGSGAACTIPAP